MFFSAILCQSVSVNNAVIDSAMVPLIWRLLFHSATVNALITSVVKYRQSLRLVQASTSVVNHKCISLVV